MTTDTAEKRGLVSLLQEYSIPLIGGVILAVIMANVLQEHTYHEIVEWTPFGPNANVFGHTVTLHWLINDVFMVFFFGIAAKEITEAMLPGGALNPPSKAINPLLGTLGGVVGPVAVFILLTHVFYSGAEAEAVRTGWGIPTATDIALAWLVARIVFGAQHPAVNFLLLLAIADDAIGLIIIAVVYPDPAHPAEPLWLGLVLLGMLVAYLMRKKGVTNWIPYIAIAGVLSWLGFLNAYLHPALALVPIVPFLPAGRKDAGLFIEEENYDEMASAHNTLDDFEHSLKKFVDFGLFFFGVTNAGVAFSSFSAVTIIVVASLIVGKTIGVAGFAFIGNKLGFKYPEGMSTRHVTVAGVIAGVGLTVALFVAGQAYPTSGAAAHGEEHGETSEMAAAADSEHGAQPSADTAAGDEAEHAATAANDTPSDDPAHGTDDENSQEEETFHVGQFQGPAKMGALMSAFAALIAIVLGRFLNVKKLAE